MSKDSSSNYYQKIKEGTQKKFCERYQNLTKEGKSRKWQYVQEQFNNHFEDEKQRLVHYWQIYYEMWENKDLL